MYQASIHSDHATNSAGRKCARAYSSFRSGYSFPEVLFAVVVLGIGFIMIAAIFPVAISQSKATSDETTAAAIAQGAVGTLSRLSYDARTTTPPYPDGVLRATGQGAGPSFPGFVRAVDSPQGWGTIRGNLIFNDDPRYAFVPLYRRDGNIVQVQPPPTPQIPTWVGSAQIYVVAVQCRTTGRPVGAGTISSASVTIPARVTQTFDLYDVSLDTSAAVAPNPINNPNNLTARQIKIKLTNSNVGPDILEVNPTRSNVAGTAENYPDAIAEGAYIVVSDTGRIYRIGAPRTDIATATVPVTGGNVTYPAAWELIPGNDMQDATEDRPANTNAMIVGRERLADGTFIGPAQDIAIYTTIIPVSP